LDHVTLEKGIARPDFVDDAVGVLNRRAPQNPIAVADHHCSRRRTRLRIVDRCGPSQPSDKIGGHDGAVSCQVGRLWQTEIVF
jgi:hypothetical protein